MARVGEGEGGVSGSTGVAMAMTFEYPVVIDFPPEAKASVTSCSESKYSSNGVSSPPWRCRQG